jgi:hypothetical protein
MTFSPAVRSHVLAGATGLGLLGATAALPYVHFTAHGGGGDVTLYERYATQVLDGELPYHSFFFEYPPLSLVALVLPKATGLDYAISLRLLMWVLLAVSLVAVLHTLRTLEADAVRLYGAAVLIGSSPALIGPITFERFDAWPAALLSVSLALLTARRWTGGSVLLALAICTKLYPIVVAPVALARVVSATGARMATRAAAAGVIAAAVVTLPFAAIGLGGLGFSYYVQFKRPLQLESAGAAVLLGLDRLGLADTTVQSGLSKDLAGSAAAAVALASTAVQLAAIAAAAWWFWQGPRGRFSTLTAAAATVVSFVAFGKVLSPQYVIWIVPLVPLVARRIWLPAMALTVAAAGLTGLYFPLHYSGIRMVTDWVWVLVARDAALIALAVLLLEHLRREARQERVQREKPPNVSRTYPSR